MLEKYGLDRKEAQAFCLIQMTSPPSVIMENGGHEVVDGREYYLEDDECPLAILMNHPPSRGTYHVGYATENEFQTNKQTKTRSGSRTTADFGRVWRFLSKIGKVSLRVVILSGKKVCISHKKCMYGNSLYFASFLLTHTYL